MMQLFIILLLSCTTAFSQEVLSAGNLNQDPLNAAVGPIFNELGYNLTGARHFKGDYRFKIASKNSTESLSIFLRFYPDIDKSSEAYRIMTRGVVVGVTQPPFEVGDQAAWVLAYGNRGLFVRAGLVVFSINCTEQITPTEVERLAQCISKFRAESWTATNAPKPKQ